MIRYAVNKKNHKVFTVEGRDEESVLLVVNGRIKPIKASTFKRYYKMLDQQDQQVVKDAQKIEKQKQIGAAKCTKTWKDYTRPYKRNDKPLWDAVTKNGELLVRDSDKNIIMSCRLSETGNCVSIKQLATDSRRYFSNFSRARKHVLNNQDIRTIQSIGKVFDKWLADQRLAMNLYNGIDIK